MEKRAQYKYIAVIHQESIIMDLDIRYAKGLVLKIYDLSVIRLMQQQI